MRSWRRIGVATALFATVLAAAWLGIVESAQQREHERAALEFERQMSAQLQASFPLRGIADVFPQGR
jgi:hypothetical protein